MHILTSIFAVAVLAALSWDAHAGPLSDGAVTITRGRSVVDFGDLSIETERDAKILLQRIERAARQACGGHPTFSSTTGGLDRTFEECRSEAVARTVKQLGAPMVTRVFSDRSRPRFDHPS